MSFLRSSGARVLRTGATHSSWTDRIGEFRVNAKPPIIRRMRRCLPLVAVFALAVLPPPDDLDAFVQAQMAQPPVKVMLLPMDAARYPLSGILAEKPRT